MKKKIAIWVFIIFAILLIKPHVWHSFKDTYSITGTVKSIRFSGTRSQNNIYVNFKTTDGMIYNFHYSVPSSVYLEHQSFKNLTRLTEGDEVELSIYSVGYYFVDSSKERIAIYVKDVKWLK